MCSAARGAVLARRRTVLDDVAKAAATVAVHLDGPLIVSVERGGEREALLDLAAKALDSMSEAVRVEIAEVRRGRVAAVQREAGLVEHRQGFGKRDGL